MIVLAALLVALVVAGSLAMRHRPSRGSPLSPPQSHPRRDPADLRAVLDRAVERGQVTRDVADDILRAELEAQPTGVAEPAAREPTRTVSPVAETLGYVGAALAIIGAATFVGRAWSELTQAGRLGVLGGVTLVFLVVGLLLRDEAEPVIWRLRNFVWLLSIGALAGFMAVLGVDTLDLDGKWVAVLIGTSVAVYGAVLWFGRDRPAPHAATLIGLLVAAGGLSAEFDGMAALGVTMIVLGAAWALLGARGILVPQYTAVPLGLVTMLIGPAVTFDSWHKQAPLIGLTLAVGVVIAGSVLDEFILTGTGVLAVMGYLPFTLAQWFGDRLGPPAILLTSGVVLLAVMLVLVRRGPKGHHGRPGIPTPLA